MNFSFRASMLTAAVGAASFTMSAVTAVAAPLVTYTFEAANDTLRRNPTSVGAGVTATPIANGTYVENDVITGGMLAAGTIFREAPVVTGPGDWGIFQKADSFSKDPGADSPEDALAQNVYWSFTVQSQVAGQSISVAELTFDTLYYLNDADATLFVRSSVDDYASNLGGGTFTINTATRTPRRIPLSSAYQNLTDPLTFRFYMYAQENPTNNRGAFTAGLDNITLNVPEPAALGLLGLGSLLALRRPRRQA